MTALRRLLPSLTLALAISALYLYRLDGTGVLSSDEPRYAAIGRAMAQSGDWITPRLWGSPWFEKPPLLYWLTALGTTAGLNPDLAGRVPVALLSLSFLVFYFWSLRREFSLVTAVVSTTLLATSAGWLAFSTLCVTDLPLSVFFACALLLALPLLRIQPPEKGIGLRFAAMGVFLGLAALAKGLVPIALALPLLWFLRRYWRNWWLAIIACLAVAGPWYAVMYARYGYAFVEEFFLKHHFERLYSNTLQHVQPWYYYIPVFLAGLFPWTPLVGLLLRRGESFDERRRFLLTVVGFGVLLFSVSLNKLPGYVLPLFPSFFAAIGLSFETKRVADLSRAWLAACALLIAAIPLVAHVLPEALRSGHISLQLLRLSSKTEFFYLVVPIAVVFIARRSWIPLLLVLCVVSGGIYLKDIADPLLDREVSARGLWREFHGKGPPLCDAGLSRNWVYGFAFYNNSPLPPCAHSGPRTELSQQGNKIPQINIIQ